MTTRELQLAYWGAHKDIDQLLAWEVEEAAAWHRALMARTFPMLEETREVEALDEWYRALEREQAMCPGRGALT